MQDDSTTSLRRLRRISATIPVSLLPEREHSQSGHDAYTVDLTRLGARVRTTFVLVPGELVGVVPNGDTGKTIPSRVVWVERAAASGSLAGLEFLDTPQA